MHENKAARKEPRNARRGIAPAGVAGGRLSGTPNPCGSIRFGMVQLRRIDEVGHVRVQHCRLVPDASWALAADLLVAHTLE
ncbi:hypothetical protein GCM10023081_39540 [Arthrobacter ginkgonis]|uniref:Uncharacterized protein n=1 Tax=Arthrobacter ginkgonis TaxID=1630594 RepID=A0ABP7CZN7_9MICC